MRETLATLANLTHTCLPFAWPLIHTSRSRRLPHPAVRTLPLIHATGSVYAVAILIYAVLQDPLLHDERPVHERVDVALEVVVPLVILS